jgi:hypothetical protein
VRSLAEPKHLLLHLGETLGTHLDGEVTAGDHDPGIVDQSSRVGEGHVLSLRGQGAGGSRAYELRIPDRRLD